ncbi:cyclin-dependent protein kinase inhibitor [Irpex lacteus]|nr:cyclin-dependent protein kinase inhibitor [Irpex lacteus]
MEFFSDVGGDPLKPSLFELVAQEQLGGLLQPALKYVLSVFAQRYPRYLLRVVNRHEEFYAALMFFVERHYLRTHGASFAENFYGLKRRRRPLFETERAHAVVGGVPAEEKLRGREIWRSMIFLVGLPYLRAKAHDYFEALGGGVDHDLFDENEQRRQARSLGEETVAARLRRTFKKVYPWLNTGFEVWLFVCNVAYLFDKTPFYRPWLRWIGVDIRRMGMDDMLAARRPSKGSLAKDLPQGLLAKLRRLLISSPRLLLDSLRILLPTAIFFIRFLEWWYSPSSPARTLAVSPQGPPVPPPRMLPPHPRGLQIDGAKYGECGLCHNAIANATAFPSGYVFCYRCAHDYVLEHGRCPVTLLPARFGKQIQADQVPGWSQHYLDYKSLKKIISSFESNRPVAEAAALAVERCTTGTPGSDPSGVPLLPPGFGSEDDNRGREFQAYKATFFFKLERELEKINAFYLEKEAELKTRLETLLSKRRAAASRVLPDSLDDYSTKNHVEWNAVEEGFHLLERDLGKLQQFVEINATGFRKILKKWDKRSKSTTKELYLARQVDVQPVFNRQLISELSDTVAACLLDLTDLSVGVKYESSAPEDPVFTRQLSGDTTVPHGPFSDLESSIRRAIADEDRDALTHLVQLSESLTQTPEARLHATRVLWKAVIDAPADLADLILSSTSEPFNYLFIDDINGRTCLHEAARVGALRLVILCLENGVQRDKVDVYGRSALHYAAMNGHAAVCERLIQESLDPNLVDLDNCTPLIYATLQGSVEAVRVLLQVGRVSAQATVLNGDLMPLSLAARAGHFDVVVLLLEHGAPSLPNTNGEYPIHLAAQEGHPRICKLLASHEGWDTPDKYNEWTPLFHAARYGHEECLRVLLDAGSRADRTDEVGHAAVHYAAWYGHHTCVSRLMKASLKLAGGQSHSTHTSPFSDTVRSLGADSDVDAIPSLSLPPPMMPYRVYGHNYLDKNALVQITIGHPCSRFGEPSAASSKAVSLRSPLNGLERTEGYLHTSPRLKLVVTASPAVTAAPFSVALPLTDDKVVYSFQAPSLEALSLDFSLYPNFGTKLIGRAASLPASFASIRQNQAFILPILDHHLNTIGEVAFEVSVVKPFSGVTLQIGGAVETYWKSIATPLSTPTPKLSSTRSTAPPRIIASAYTSPSIYSSTATASHSLTHSSISGNFIYITVQVTRDLQPVTFCEWRLPEDAYELGVADVTLSQFNALAQRVGRFGLNNVSGSASLSDLHKAIAGSMMPLSDLLKLLPATLGICLELAYPSTSIQERHSIRHQVPLNDVVDAVLRTIYDITSLEGHVGRRNVVFTSFSPDICSALNWKQPNYPVFFASQCGRICPRRPSATALSIEDSKDYRLSSLHCAVELCKANNMLGLLLDAELLVSTTTVKEFGLLLGAFGATEQIAALSVGDNSVDAFLQDGILTYSDYSKRGY